MWKEVKGYEGLYQISDTGLVRSLHRTVLNKNGKPQNYLGKLLKPDTYKMPNSSYQRVTLSKEGITKRFLVHRLVAEAFIPNPQNKEHVNHIDNNGLNNSVENLEWCSHSENMLHAQKQGRLFASQSKGGKKGSKTNQLKRDAKLKEIQESWVNDWYVTSEPTFQRAKKTYVPVVCRCGTPSNMELGRLLRAEATACRKCNNRWVSAS